MRKMYFALAVILLLVGFGLRAYRLDYQSFWDDEGISLTRAGLPVSQIVAEMPPEHAPLYFLVLHFWLELTGPVDFAIRYLSLIPGVLVIAALYRLGRDLNRGSPVVAFLAALIVAANPFLVWHSQDARMYTWLLFFTLASTLWLWRALEWAGSSWKTWAGYALFTSAAIYTHHFGFLVPAAHLVFFGWGWLRGRYRGRERRWLCANAAVGALYLPWVPRALGVLGFPGWREPVSLLSLPRLYVSAYSLGSSVPSRFLLPLTIGFALLGVIGAWDLARSREEGDAPARALNAVMLLVPVAGVTALLIRKPDFHERYLIAVTPYYYLLLARGMRWLGRRWLPLGVLSVVFALGAGSYSLAHHYNDPHFAKPDFRSVALQITRYGQSNDVILFDGPNPERVFTHYYKGDLPIYDVNDVDPGNVEAIGRALGDVTHDKWRLWLVLYLHPPGPVEEYLVRDMYQAFREDYSGVWLHLYGARREGAEQVEEVLSFGENVELLGYEWQPGPLPGGSVFPLRFRWRAASHIGEEYKVSIRLLDESGHIYWGLDRPPLDGFLPTTAWEPGLVVEDTIGAWAVPGIPPGDYRVELRLYRADTGSPLTVNRGGTQMEALSIGPMRVTQSDSVFSPGAVYHGSSTGAGGPVYLADDLAFLGYTVGADAVKPGETLPVCVYWYAPTAPRGDYGVGFSLLDADGNSYAASRFDVAKNYPTSLWRAGETLKVFYDLPIPPDIPNGAGGGSIGKYKYTVRMELLGEDAGLLASTELSRVQVSGRERSFELPGHIPHVQGAGFGGAVSLLGYDTGTDEVPPGGVLPLTLYWKAEAGMEVDYTVFVHLLDSGGRVAAQVDSRPLGGEAPTTGWLPGEVIADRHQLDVPKDVPPGEYRIEIGFYDPASGERLPAFDEAGERLPDDRVLLDSAIRVVGGD